MLCKPTLAALSHLSQQLHPPHSLANARPLHSAGHKHRRSPSVHGENGRFCHAMVTSPYLMTCAGDVPVQKCLTFCQFMQAVMMIKQEHCACKIWKPQHDKCCPIKDTLSGLRRFLLWAKMIGSISCSQESVSSGGFRCASGCCGSPGLDSQQGDAPCQMHQGRHGLLHLQHLQ